MVMWCCTRKKKTPWFPAFLSFHLFISHRINKSRHLKESHFCTVSFPADAPPFVELLLTSGEKVVPPLVGGRFVAEKVPGVIQADRFLMLKPSRLQHFCSTVLSMSLFWWLALLNLLDGRMVCICKIAFCFVLISAKRSSIFCLSDNSLNNNF